MSSDSSNSDDQTRRLKEALDTSFLKDDLYRDDKCIAEKSIEQSKLQSLRHQNHQEVTANPFSIKVTPEFQKHVSRHLSKLLDKTIDDTEVFLQVKKSKKKPGKTGIRLLLSSKKFLKYDGNTEICGHSRKCTRKISGKEIDFEARAKEVAVSSEWVLSKEEVKSWALNWKNNVEVLQLDEHKSKRKKR